MVNLRFPPEKQILSRLVQFKKKHTTDSKRLKYLTKVDPAYASFLPL